MLVRGFRKHSPVRLAVDSLLVRHKGVTLVEWSASVFLLEFFEENFKMKLSATCDNVLTRLLSKSQS